MNLNNTLLFVVFAIIVAKSKNSYMSPVLVILAAWAVVEIATNDAFKKYGWSTFWITISDEKKSECKVYVNGFPGLLPRPPPNSKYKSPDDLFGGPKKSLETK